MESPEENAARMSIFPNLALPDEEQKQIVRTCNTYKKAVIEHAREKKLKMRRCYAYANSKFNGDDLLPMPATLGSDNDNNPDRPQVFMPMTREQVKILYSYIKLTLFNNDEDYFRVKAKGPEGAQLEDNLTEGLKYVFRQIMVSEKAGKSIFNTIWSGIGVVMPYIRQSINTSYEIDPQTMSYIPNQEITGEIDIDIWNPLHFYPDPRAKSAEKSRWGYFTQEKLQDIVDDVKYMNKDQLQNLSTKTVRDTQDYDGLGLSEFNDVLNQFEDTQENLKVDYYYFPFIKTDAKEYRNMRLAVAGSNVLIQATPNVMPKGLNPCVFWTWMDEIDSPYGVGPAEDMADIQRLVNILYNFMIEDLARSGNRYVARPGVDFTNAFGVAGGIIEAENPQEDVVNLTGNPAQLELIQNVIGAAKSEAQIVAGSQDPFQGSSNIDFKKTATEIQLLQSNSISIIREVCEHISVTGIARLMERLMYLVPLVHQDPITVPIETPQGTQYRVVDFSPLTSGEFTIEIIGSNPSQSKEAQVESLTQLLQLILGNPAAITIGQPIISQIANLQGIKDIDNILSEVQERMMQVAQQHAQEAAAAAQAQQQGIPGQEGGGGAPPMPPMGHLPPPHAGGQMPGAA